MSNKISDIYIFEWMDREFIDKIIDNSRMVKFSSWETIIKQWEALDYAYIIQDWEVNVERDWEIINSIEEWNIFWEIALITHEPRTASIIAKTDVKLLKINKDLLEGVLEELPNWAKIKDIIRERIMMNFNR